jgi:hypothetical protein
VDLLIDAESGVWQAVHTSNVLAGFCYTQFADTYQEAIGLLYADRRPKFPIEAIRMATRPRGGRPPFEAEWRERIMQAQRTQYLIPAEDHHTHSNAEKLQFRNCPHATLQKLFGRDRQVAYAFAGRVIDGIRHRRRYADQRQFRESLCTDRVDVLVLFLDEECV